MLIPKIGVAVWVISDGKVLLGKRKNAHGEGAWAPPGGHLEFGESPEMTAQRELKEETNLEALILHKGPWTHDYFENLKKHYLTIHLFVTEFSGSLQAMEPRKCEEWSWFSIEKLPKHVFLSVQNLLAFGSLKEHLEHAMASIMRG